MAKNKNQKQESRPQQPMESRSAEVRGPEQAKAASTPQQEILSADTPSTAKKKQKKLGHN